MSWHFLQGQEAESWEGHSLDGAPSALLKLMPTPEECSLLANVTECSPPFRSGTTCAHSTGAPGLAKLTLCPAVSHAKTYRRPERGKGSTANALAFGATWQELSVRYDRDTCSWRTHRSLWDEDLSACSLTLPRWGSMRDGVLSERTTVPLPTSANDSGLWPTPVASDTGDRKRPYAQGGTPLSLAVKYMTPTAQIGKKCGGRHRGKADTLASQIAELEGLKQTSTGRLNPQWVEWLMGWPTGWTDCAALAMDRFRVWWQQHGGF